MNDPIKGMGNLFNFVARLRFAVRVLAFFTIVLRVTRMEGLPTVRRDAPSGASRRDGSGTDRMSSTGDTSEGSHRHPE